MPWEKVSSNTYQRPLDGSESCIKSLAYHFRDIGHEYLVITTSAKLKFRRQQRNRFERLQKAWAYLRLKNPFIAATIDSSSNNYVYESPKDNKAIQQWVSRTCILHESGNPLEYFPKAGVPHEASTHFFVQSSEIIIRCSHTLIDGRGALHLMNNLLMIFANLSDTQSWPVFGDEVQRLTISPSEAAQWPTESTPDVHEQTEQMIQGMFSNPSMGMPIKSAQVPKETAFTSKVIDPETVKKFKRTCKDKGYGLTATIHAAVARAFFEQAADSESEIFTHINNFDIRSTLPAPYNDISAWPMGYWIMSIPFAVHKSSSFAECATYFTEVYKTPVTIDGNPVVNVYDNFLGKLADIYSQSFTPPAVPLLSNWGEISHYIKATYEGVGDQFSVEDVMPFGNAGTATFPFLCSFWHGRLRMTIAYEQAWYSEDVTRKFLDRVHQILFEEFISGRSNKL